jgi:2-keto-3-deoxy-L-rhamnonate aldolase RhmA
LETLDYVRSANADSLIIPLLETREAVDNHAAILEVPGLEGIWFGPADMSSSYGCFGQWDAGPVADAILAICQAAKAKGISCGIMAKDGSDARVRWDQGFQWITVGTDINLMMNSIRGFMTGWQSAT